MKVGITIDNYKLPVFKENLKGGGFDLLNEIDLGSVIILIIETDEVNLSVLKGIIEKSNKEAIKCKNKLN